MMILKSIVYLLGGFLLEDVQSLLKQFSEIRKAMATAVDQILENQRALTTALSELADVQQKTLDELKAEIEELKNQGADVDKLNEILESQQNAIDTIKRLKDSAVAAEPKLVAFIEEQKTAVNPTATGDLKPVEEKETAPSAPPSNFPAQVPPPMHQPTTVSTESVETAKGQQAVVHADGTTEIKDADGKTIAKEDLPENFKR